MSAAAAAGSRGRGLHGQLVQQLGQMIVSGDLGADRPLVPEEIGQRFEVSRTVVRESLRVLEAKGLVSARPNVGTRVRPVSDWNLLDPDIIEWRAFGPQRDDQRRELQRAALDDRAARRPPRRRARPRGGPAAARRHGRDHGPRHELRATRSPSRAPTPSSTALLIQLAGNRMLEHLSGIVSAALQVSGGPITGCDRPDRGVARRTTPGSSRLSAPATVRAAEAAMRQLLTVHPEVERVVPAPREH